MKSREKRTTGGGVRKHRGKKGRKGKDKHKGKEGNRIGNTGGRKEGRVWKSQGKKGRKVRESQ